MAAFAAVGACAAGSGARGGSRRSQGNLRLASSASTFCGYSSGGKRFKRIQHRRRAHHAVDADSRFKGVRELLLGHASSSQVVNAAPAQQTGAFDSTGDVVSLRRLLLQPRNRGDAMMPPLAEEPDEDAESMSAEEVLEAEVWKAAAEAAEFFGATTQQIKQQLMGVQGYWEELDTGMTVEVTGDMVDFNDGNGPSQLELDPEGLSLRGRRLAGGFPELAVWQQRDSGKAMVWARAPHIDADPVYPFRFFGYKASRTILRSSLVKAVKAECYDEAANLMKAWRSTWGLPEKATTEQELRLAPGRYFVPGVCVRHAKYGFRAVVLGCEPFIRAPVARVMSAEQRKAKSGLPDYRLQSICICLVDDRDSPRGGISYILEEDLVTADDVYPIQSKYSEALLEPEDCLRGYIPGAVLRAAMKRQSFGLPWTLVR